MKKLVHHFVDWMEKGPAILTIWFIPLLFCIAFVAMIINQFKPRKDIVTK